MAAAAPAMIPVPGAGPLAAPGAVGPIAGGPNTGAIAGLPPAPAAAVAVPAALGPPAGLPATLAALNLPAGIPAPAAPPGGGDPYVTAWEKINLLASTNQNNNLIAGKANDFRTIVIGRLRQIYFRIRSIQNLAAGGQDAARALVAILDQINQHGYTTAEATALNQLASDLNNINVSDEMAGLVQEVNNLVGALGLTPAQMANIGAAPLDPGDTTGDILAGGRRKRKKAKKSRKKKKKHKGGFKYTRIANSRRSLRMTRRKSLRHKKHHKKRKRTKKHRGRKRR